MLNTRKIILMLDSSRAADRGFIRGIINYSQGRGHWSFYRFSPLFKTFPFSNQKQESLLERLNKLDADGIIGYLPAEKKLLKTIMQKNFPVVALPVNDPITGITNIKQSTRVGIMGAEHLLDRGFEHLAFCGSNDHWSIIRRVGFIQKIEQSGLPSMLYPVPENKIKPEGELKKLTQWVNKLPKPVGIMASNDEQAAEIVEACQLAELSIPDEVAILGVDNDEMICTLSNPPISSIQLNNEKVGYLAAEAIDTLIKNNEAKIKNIIIEPVNIITRQSSDIIAIDDEHVSAAIRFIRSNSRRAIHVQDVIEQSILSSRALQQRFQKFLGRTINHEIRRVRVLEFANLLISTNETVKTLSYDMQFGDIGHISRIFKKEMEMTPIEYRRKYGKK